MNALFGARHIILILTSIALIVLFFFLSKKMKYNQICKTLFYIGIVSEITKIFYFIITNEDKGWLTYILHYAFLIIVCVTLCYIKPVIEGIKSLVKKDNVEA